MRTDAALSPFAGRDSCSHTEGQDDDGRQRSPCEEAQQAQDQGGARAGSLGTQMLSCLTASFGKNARMQLA